MSRYVLREVSWRPSLTDTTVFTGNMVVSMRPYPIKDIERVRAITRPYIETHGEPVAWVSRPELDLKNKLTIRARRQQPSLE